MKKIYSIMALVMLAIAFVFAACTTPANQEAAYEDALNDSTIVDTNMVAIDSLAMDTTSVR